MDLKYFKYKTKYLELKQKINMRGGSGKGDMGEMNNALGYGSSSSSGLNTLNTSQCRALIKFHNTNEPMEANIEFMRQIVTNSADYIKNLTYVSPMLYEDYDKNDGLKLDELQQINKWNSTNNKHTMSNDGMVISDHKYIEGEYDIDNNESIFSWNATKNTDYFSMKPNTKRLSYQNSSPFINSRRRIEMIAHIVYERTINTNNILITIQECDLSLHKLLENILVGHCGHFIPKRMNYVESENSKCWIQEDGMSIFVRKGHEYNLTLLTYSAPQTDNLKGLNTRTALVEFPDKNIIVTHCRPKAEYDAFPFIRDTFLKYPTKPLYAIGDFNRPLIKYGHVTRDMGDEFQTINLDYDVLTTRDHVDHLIKIKERVSANGMNSLSSSFGTKSTWDRTKYTAKNTASASSSASSASISNAPVSKQVPQISGRYAVKITGNDHAGMCTGSVTRTIDGSIKAEDSIIKNIICTSDVKVGTKTIVSLNNGEYTIEKIF